MSKKANPRRLADNEAKATIRMLRISPQKLNLLAQLIRGKKVSTALADLQFSNKRISVEVKKALESAIANAENNHELDVDDLVVAQAYVGKDMVMKRFSPRARGRAGRIEKPFSNITIIVREVAAATAPPDSQNVVRAFYAALAASAGDQAASLIVPSKREAGPLSATAISSFYSRLEQPLELLAIESTGPDTYLVRYRYKAPRSAICNGRAIVTTTTVSGSTLISHINALDGC